MEVGIGFNAQRKALQGPVCIETKIMNASLYAVC